MDKEVNRVKANLVFTFLKLKTFLLFHILYKSEGGTY